MSRDAELDAFKRLNLSLVASAFGYEIVRKKSTRQSVLMESGSDKIIVTRNGEHYVYCSVHDPISAGTVIDLVQKSIEPGCSLGRVRQVLRPFLGSGYVTTLQTEQQGKYQSEIESSEPDLPGVSVRLARFEPIERPNAFLNETRGIPFELLQSERLVGRVLCCPRRGSIIFPHWGSIEAADTLSEAITGYEIKGRGVSLFSKNGRKGLWLSAPSPDDRVLVIAESGLDAISYLAVRGEERTRVASISGQMNARQPELLREVMRGLPQGSSVVAAFDNDRGGDGLVEKLGSLVAGSGRADLSFRGDRPRERGSDWNQVLMSNLRIRQRHAPSLGR